MAQRPQSQTKQTLNKQQKTNKYKYARSQMWLLFCVCVVVRAYPVTWVYLADYVHLCIVCWWYLCGTEQSILLLVLLDLFNVYWIDVVWVLLLRLLLFLFYLLWLLLILVMFMYVLWFWFRLRFCCCPCLWPALCFCIWADIMWLVSFCIVLLLPIVLFV